MTATQQEQAIQGLANQGGNNNRPDNQPPWDNSRRDNPLNSGGNSAAVKSGINCN
jgi:hypothetical protein